jgi:diguanylate cyclase (GGDEF)-like protein
MLDLDHFKRLNDEHGHLVGDQVLREVASAIAGALRTSDTAYRYGGEELVVLLRETGLEEAAKVAERIREAIAGVVLPDRLTVTVTASAGVAARQATMSHYTELVAAADQALYDAKRRGRNRVSVTGLTTETLFRGTPAGTEIPEPLAP